MKKMPHFLESDKLKRSIDGDGNKREAVNGMASSSMLLTTEQLAEAIPPTYRSTERDLIELTPEERAAAVRREAEVPEGEFYGFRPLSERRRS